MRSKRRQRLVGRCKQWSAATSRIEEHCPTLIPRRQGEESTDWECASDIADDARNDCLYMLRQWPCGCTLSLTWFPCRAHSALPSQTAKRGFTNARAIRFTNLTSNPIANPADLVQVNSGFRAQRVQRVDQIFRCHIARRAR